MAEGLREKVERKSYRILAIRPHSEKELAEKLRHAGFPEGLIEEAMAKCRRLGYLDDEAFARQRARYLAEGRLLGDRRILRDLTERGIGRELALQALQEVRKELSEEEALAKVLAREGARAREEGQAARLARRLAGKGFPLSLIRERLLKREDAFDGDDWQ